MFKVNKKNSITISVVSHGQADLVQELLKNLVKCSEIARIILTHNIPENNISFPEELAGRILIVSNDQPLGFGANHNNAFRYCNTPFFCVLNPDIRLLEDPFPTLLKCLSNESVSISAPAIVNSDRTLEDSARRFPTPLGIILKLLGVSDGSYTFSVGDQPLRPDWLAGMFLLIRSEHFATVNGFDEGFYMYYEDVDLCVRLRKAGLDLLLCPSTSAVHEARRTSHRNIRYMGWHARSMMRFFVKNLGSIWVPGC